MGSYIMAMDSGTTSNRCMLFDREGKIVSSAQKEFAQYYPQNGWVEQDANEIWSSMLGVAVEAKSKAGLSASDIEAIGITNQRETVVVWDKRTAEPVYPAIVWQCRRTAALADELKKEGLGDWIRAKTGLTIDAYFSATKIKWILDNVEGAREKAEAGHLLFGTVETWLIFRLTGGRVHITDYSNASRTMLFHIRDLKWDREILRKFDIPECMLPEVKASSLVYGVTDPALFGGEIPIAGAAGDQQSALFGQTCFSMGEAKATFGTGGFLLMNTGQKPIMSNNGLITTIAWGINDKINYALEGSIFAAGAAVQWLRDEMRLIRNAAESETLASQVGDTDGCYMVPAFTGLGAPYWDPYARGAIIGMTRSTNRYHIIRATLESVAYQTSEVLQAMERDAELSIEALKVDGGASANQFMMQFLADIMHFPVQRPKSVESTALGAAFLAGLATGFWKDQDEIKGLIRIEKQFEPKMDEETRKEKLLRWKEAVRRSLSWEK